MRAVTITRAGGPEVLTVTDHPVRAAGPGEVRIAVKAAAVNPTDILMRQNPEVYAKGSPGIPGMDAAGIIESVGEGEDRLRVGDEVMAVATPRRPEGGAQIELLVVPAASVVPIPRAATIAQASTLPMNGLTARLALELINLSAGQTLAVSGGAGLLAHYMIVLAKQRGLRVIADAKPSETELVRSYGADIVVPRGDRFGYEVRAELPGGADALFDTALLGRDSFSAIRDGGVYVPVRGWDDQSIRARYPHSAGHGDGSTDPYRLAERVARPGVERCRSRCVSLASTRRSVPPTLTAPWRPAACAAAASSSFRGPLMTSSAHRCTLELAGRVRDRQRACADWSQRRANHPVRFGCDRPLMARIFITGSTDGLGHAAAKALIDEGHQVVCTRDLVSAPRPSLISRHGRLAWSSAT